MSATRTFVAIVGPTASGKGQLAVAAARATGARLLSCDSMKVYRGLEIGTAKPSAASRDGVDWHGLDLVWPWEAFDASRFRDLFDEVLAAADADGRPLLLVGGTMLYLKAASEGLAEVPPRDPALRERLTAEAEAKGTAALHARLAEVDSETAARVHPNDLRRIVRALEVYETTGAPISELQGQFGSVREDLERVVFVIEREREDLDARINARVETMLEAGWLDECRRLRQDERGISREAAQALGYRQLFEWLDVEEGERAPLGSVVEGIQAATRRFARRQMTWLRHLEHARTLRVGPGESPIAHLDEVVRELQRASSS